MEKDSGPEADDVQGMEEVGSEAPEEAIGLLVTVKDLLVTATGKPETQTPETEANADPEGPEEQVKDTEEAKAAEEGNIEEAKEEKEEATEEAIEEATIIEEEEKDPEDLEEEGAEEADTTENLAWKSMNSSETGKKSKN